MFKEAIGRQLNKSARQVSKMREIAKKADTSLLEKIKMGSIPINKAYEMIKANKAKKKTGENANEEEVSLGTEKGINQDSFKLGELTLSDEDVARISRRFGIV